MKPALLAFAFLFAVAPATALASWSPDGNPVVQAPGHQRSFAAIPFGAGGILVAWIDDRNDAGDVYAAALDSAGDPAAGWPANGIPVCTAMGEQRDVSLATDGAGGAYLYWLDRRSGSLQHYLQRVTNVGTLASGWPVDGQFIAAEPGDPGPYAIASDGVDGVYVCWSTGSSPAVTRITGSGSTAAGWPDTLPGPGAADPSSFTLTADGTGGVLAVKPAQYFPGALSFFRRSPDGTSAPGWPGEGVLVDGFYVMIGSPSLILDGAGGVFGVFMTWNGCDHCDYYNGTAVRIRLDSTVDPAWPRNGQYVGVGSVSVSSDGVGGLLVTSPERVDYNSRGRIVRLESDASSPAGWNSYGNEVCDQPYAQGAVTAAPDGAGGAFIGWIDLRDHGVPVLYAMRMDADGSFSAGWPTPGSLECLAAVNPSSPQVVAADPDRGIVVWVDERNGASDIYAKLMAPGPAGPPSPAAVPPNGARAFGIRSVAPNPSRGTVTVALDLRGGVPARIEVVDLAGRVVERQQLGAAGPAHRALVVNASARLSPGVYWLRASEGVEIDSRRIVIAH